MHLDTTKKRKSTEGGIQQQDRGGNFRSNFKKMWGLQHVCRSTGIKKLLIEVNIVNIFVESLKTYFWNPLKGTIRDLELFLKYIFFF